MRGSSSWPAIAASTVSTCWTRSNVSPSRSMYSSSTPSVYGSLLPKVWSSTLPPRDGALAGDRGGIDLLHSGSIASTSISTSQRGSSRLRRRAGAGRADVARRTRRARARSPASPRRRVTKIRVRTTSSRGRARLGERARRRSRGSGASARRRLRAGRRRRGIGAVPATWNVPTGTTRAREPDAGSKGEAGMRRALHRF